MITDKLMSIKRHYPEMDVFSAKIYKYDRSNHVLLVNKDYIFRFPKSDKGVFSLKKEAKLLRKLDDSFRLRIPYPEFLNFEDDNVGETFIGYKKLEGRPSDAKELKESPNYGNNLEKIILFLRDLHMYSKFSLDLSYFNDNFQNSWRKHYDDILADNIILKGIDKNFIVEEFEKFFKLIDEEEYEESLIHGDFQISNILFDNGRVASIIDFEDSIIGDRAYDYATLIISLGEGRELLDSFKDIIKGNDNFYMRLDFYLLVIPLILTK